jgi:BirA family transcriptional regulator, biotin operon repressor / biotin---[acetyl-CoA-carboxylase] ligase
MSTFGKIHFHFETITSTNDYAIQLLSKTSPIEGTAISADFQSHGKGQFDRKWEGNKRENIAVTVVLKPHYLLIQEQYFLNKAIALSVYQTISSFVPANVIKIKWPNDILVEDKKIAGILIQNIIQGTNFKYSIVGMGINVLQTKWDTVENEPTSIKFYDTSIENPHVLFQILFKQLDFYIGLVRQRDFDLLESEYIEKLYLKGEKHMFLVDNKKIEGIIKSVNRFGQLCLEIDSEIHFIDHGTIKYL